MNPCNRFWLYREPWKYLCWHTWATKHAWKCKKCTLSLLTLGNLVLLASSTWVRPWKDYLCGIHYYCATTTLLPCVSCHPPTVPVWPPLLWHVDLSNYCGELTLTFTFCWISMNGANAACPHALVCAETAQSVCVFFCFILVKKVPVLGFFCKVS